jgi:hypothetical protein
MNDTHEEAAQQIAAAGRDALLERLRPAFRDAAAAHADVITLSDEQIEEMVQRAADRADGLQWRRALAGVAVEQLGITLSDALGHPAVVKAQELLGVPSYEEAIAAARAARAAQTQNERSAAETATPAANGVAKPAEAPPQAPPGEAETAEAADRSSARAADRSSAEAGDTGNTSSGATVEAETAESAAVQEPAEEPAQHGHAAGSWGELAAAPSGNAPAAAPSDGDEDDDEEEAAAEPRDWAEEHWEDIDLGDGLTSSTAIPRRDAREVTLPAAHVEGLGGLAGDSDVELSFTQRGLDVLRASDKLELVGLRWRDIHALEVPHIRVRMRRRRRDGARLVVYSTRGTLTFDTPGRSADEVRSRLAPFGKLR